MNSRNVRLGLSAVALIAIVVAAPLFAQDDTGKRDDAEKAKLEKELKDLEGQRKKLDEKIGALRNKLGLPHVFAYSYSMSPKVWSEEDRKKFTDKMEEAMKAYRKALEESGLKFSVPDVRLFGDGQARAFILPPLAPNEKADNALRSRFRIAPLLGDDSDLRDEVKKLRKELDELKKELGKDKKGSETKPALDIF